jgi:hypothetical protein
VFGRLGVIFIMLWGLAYLSICYTYVNVPYLVLLFALEKLTYVLIYIYVVKTKSEKIKEVSG